MYLGMRMRTLTYVYDDPEHPDRPTSAIQSPDYTPEDRALLMGLDLYEATRCACGHPRAEAWHSDMDGFYDPPPTYVCHACSAGRDKKVIYTGIPINTRDMGARPLPPFLLGVTTADS